MTLVLQRSANGISGWTDIPSTTDVASYIEQAADVGNYIRVKETVGGVVVYSNIIGPVVDSGGGGSTPPVAVGSLLFFDEFDGVAGAKPDSTKWAAKAFTANVSGTIWDGLNRVQLDGNSNLQITASLVGSQWYSGYIQQWPSTYSGKRYVEALAQVPAGYGTWAAPIWENGGRGAPQMEFDVCEQLGRLPTQYQTSLHYWTSAGVNNGNSQPNSVGVTLANGFHRYGAAIYADHVDFYFDGTLIRSMTAASVAVASFTTWNNCISIDLDMGGSWAGTPTIPGPVSLLVDYVRVWAIP